MSTNSNCSFIEVKKGEWWYVLEDYNAPKNSWDWREYASAYGPFTTYEVACDHLRNNHANPGGHDMQEFQEGYEPDRVMSELMASAKERARYRPTAWTGRIGRRGW